MFKDNPNHHSAGAMAYADACSTNDYAGQQKETAFARVDSAASSVVSLVGRVENVVEMLCGSVPQSDSGKETQALPNGALSHLNMTAIGIEDAVRRTNVALDRLAKELP